MKSIYDLQLHELQAYTNYTIMRVPGGWLYTIVTDMEAGSVSSVFVPFNDEFMKRRQTGALTL